MKKYELTVSGIKRELPIIRLNESLSIASFVILGDTELVVATAKELASRIPEVDYLVTAEAKGIPLVHEVSKNLNMDRYIVARKSVKSYMDSPLIQEVNSITTADSQVLCLDGLDRKLIEGKRVALIDDVISTGESLNALESLVKSAGADVVAKVAILAEGDAAKRDDIIFLQELPLFD